MRKYIFPVTLFFYISSFAQENINKNYFSVNTYYPIPIGHNFINEWQGSKLDGPNFRGIIAFDIGYNLNMFNNLYLGLSLKTNKLHSNAFNGYAEIVNPSVNINYHYGIGKINIIPQLNIGYSLFKFYKKADAVIPSFYDSQDAVTALSSIQLSYAVSEKVAINVNLKHEYSWLDRPTGVQQFYSYNQRIMFVFSGLGVNIKINSIAQFRRICNPAE